MNFQNLFNALYYSLKNDVSSGQFLENKNKTTDDNKKIKGGIKEQKITVKQLKQYLKDNKIKGYSKLEKNDLIKLVEKVKKGLIKPEPNKKELIQYLKNNNIKGYSRLNKQELIYLVKQAKEGIIKPKKRIKDMIKEELREYKRKSYKKVKQRKQTKKLKQLEKKEKKIKKQIKKVKKTLKPKLNEEQKKKMRQYQREYIRKQKLKKQNLMYDLVKLDNDTLKSILNFTDKDGDEVIKKIFKSRNKVFKDLDKYNEYFVYLYNLLLNQSLDIYKIFNDKDILIKFILYVYNRKQNNKLLESENLYIDQYGNQETKFLTIGSKNINNIKKHLKLEYDVDSQYTEGSDVVHFIMLYSLVSLKLSLINKKKKNNHNQGGFFKYTHKLDNINFSRYGIYKEVNEKNYKVNCLYKTLYYSEQFKKEELNSIILMCRNRDISIIDLKNITNKFNFTIKLKQLRITKDNKYKTTTQNIGKSKDRIINIGLIDDHYFIIDKKTNITQFALNNYNKIKHIKNYNLIINESNKKNKKRFIDSFKLFELLLNNKNELLNQITLTSEIMSTTYYNYFNIIKSLEYEKDRDTRLINQYQNNKFETTYLKINNMSLDELEKRIKECSNYQDKLHKNTNWKDKELSKLVKKEMSLNGKLKSKLEFKLRDKRQNMNKIFFDIESDIYTNYHNPYLCCAVFYNEKNNIKKTMSFKNLYCVRSFLKTIKKDSLIIIHNAGYDFRMMINEFFGISMIKKGSQIKTVSCKYYNEDTNKTYNIRIKDSYALISMALKKFNNCFKLNNKKEVMPYKIYNTENLKKKSLYISEALNVLEYDHYYDFLKNIKEWNLKTSNNKFNHIEYSKKYCEIDCLTLFEGYMKFRQWMVEITNIDIDYMISISQLSNQYIINSKCYNDCYSISGVPREYIQKTIRGGRVMCRLNKKYMLVNKILQDFDAASLYPSAMYRLGYEYGGFLKGTPKVLKTKDYNIIKNYDGYFCRIKLNKINKRYSFSLLSYKNKNDILVYSDDINDYKNRILYVDKIFLEDLINFHKIEFEIVDGYYYNEGRNKTIFDKIKYLFNERLKKKKVKNPIQSVFKLIMNGLYGRTIMKAIEKDNLIFDTKERLTQYVLSNFNEIESYSPLYEKSTEPNKDVLKQIEDKKEKIINLLELYQINKNDELKNSIIELKDEILKLKDNKIKECQKYIVTKYKSINNHFSSPHIGAEILSMSKRIMNEVMCLADDLDIKIYYQDTDSMHIENDKIPLLKREYKKLYNKELEGNNLEQFNCDFDFKSDKEPISVNSIFLGKKCYLDKVKVVNNDKINYKYHYRMKGVSKEAIEQYINDVNNKSKFKINIEYVYKVLYHQNKMSFNLVTDKKVRFKMASNFGIQTLKDFIREIQFLNN